MLNFKGMRFPIDVILVCIHATTPSNSLSVAGNTAPPSPEPVR